MVNMNNKIKIAKLKIVVDNLFGGKVIKEFNNQRSLVFVKGRNDTIITGRKFNNSLVDYYKDDMKKVHTMLTACRDDLLDNRSLKNEVSDILELVDSSNRSELYNRTLSLLKEDNYLLAIFICHAIKYNLDMNELLRNIVNLKFHINKSIEEGIMLDFSSDSDLITSDSNHPYIDLLNIGSVTEKDIVLPEFNIPIMFALSAPLVSDNILENIIERDILTIIIALDNLRLEGLYYQFENESTIMNVNEFDKK